MKDIKESEDRVSSFRNVIHFFVSFLNEINERVVI